MPNVSTASAAETRTFVDANVLVYAYDASDAVKQSIAQAALRQLWSDGSGLLSTQILQEFYAVATGRLKPPMTPGEAREIVGLYATWPVVLIEPALILTASQLHERYQLSWWDALMVEAARVGGARRLLTEDLTDGQDIEGVRIENPFREALDAAGSQSEVSRS